MADYYKLASTGNRHTNWTTEVILEKNDKGEPTKVVRSGEPIQLTVEDRKKLEDLGYTLESSSKSEADDAAQAQPVGSDVTGSAPVFGTNPSDSPRESKSK